MHPILVELGRFRIYSYGFMLALSFWVGIILAAHRAGKRSLSKDLVYDLSIVLILCAVIGSRSLYIITHRADYRTLVDMIALWQGGATLYGGLVLAVAGAFIYLRWRKVSFLRMADVCAPSIALGVGLTRIGCFLSGCCFGAPTRLPWGVVFPAHCPAGYSFPATPLHPTQLYSSLGGLVLALALLAVDRHRRPFDGFLFAIFCISYGVGRFAIDLLRYYEPSAFVARSLTVSQALSLAMVAAGAAFIAARSRSGKRAA